MEFMGKIKAISRDLFTDEIDITFSTSQNILTEYEKLKSLEKLRIKAIQYRKKRSLNANNYAWVLMSKMASVLKTDKDSIYEIMLQKYGTPYLDDTGASEKISVLSNIDVSKFGLHTKFIGKGYVGDKEFNHYIVIKGSSEYDTKEMSDFIDGVVSDAQELDIETISPDEIIRMKEQWGVDIEKTT